MKHPSQEEWMGYVYGEISSTDKANLSAHLKQCAECAGRVTQWQGTMSSLNEWKVSGPISARVIRPAVKWAIAAALVFGVGLGFGTAYLSASSGRTTAALRQEIRQELQAEFKTQLSEQRTQLLAEVSRVIDDKRAEDKQATLAALRQVTATHRADYNSLHKELETMAVMTDSSLRQAQQEIVSLVNYSQPK
ncbi:MAG: putative transrane anti-sigma factor [Pedosphaera sp.]|nr:putative transrane anti-sigma factor [Pedosphaera sp.]